MGVNNHRYYAQTKEKPPVNTTQTSPVKSTPGEKTLSLWDVDNKASLPFMPYFGRKKKDKNAPLTKKQLRNQQRKEAKKEYLQAKTPAPELKKRLTREQRLAAWVNRPDYCATTNFEVGKIDKLTCPACGGEMMPKWKFLEFSEKLAHSKESQYIDILKDYEEYMMPTERKVFEQIKKLDEQNPEGSLKYHLLTLRKDKLPELEEVQINKLNSIKQLANKLSKYDKQRVIDVVNAGENKIYAHGKKPFKRKTFIESLDKLYIQNDLIKKQMMNIANTLPTSSELEGAWIAKYSAQTRSPKEIAERFLNLSVGNTDHVIASDNDGGFCIPNYIGMHTGCNSDKTNKSFLNWFNEDPQGRQEFIQKHLDEVQNKIEDGTISDPAYKDYIQQVTQTIYDDTKGQLDFRPKPDHDDNELAFG